MGLHSKTGILIVILLLSLSGNVFLFFLWRNDAYLDQRLHRKYPHMAVRAVDPNYSNNLVVNFLPLRLQIHNEVDPYSDSFAIDFEYLPTGTTIGINEDKEFTAESLLKVPVVMAYFHKKERLGMDVDPNVQIKQNELNKRYGDLYKKGAGYKINLANAVKLALQKSDNTASLILADQISEDDFNFVYEGLDIPKVVDKNSPVITAQEYMSILKALYYGGVLNDDNSEKVLELLTQTEFMDMLPAGVPKDIPVAHKIGLVNSQIYQDCGIVYAPLHNYTLCMVSKSDQKTAQSRMQRISKMVYEYVSQLK